VFSVCVLCWIIQDNVLCNFVEMCCNTAVCKVRHLCLRLVLTVSLVFNVDDFVKLKWSCDLNVFTFKGLMYLFSHKMFKFEWVIHNYDIIYWEQAAHVRMVGEGRCSTLFSESVQPISVDIDCVCSFYLP